MNDNKHNKTVNTVREPVRAQYGVITYPKAGNVRQFVSAMAASEPAGTVVVWDAGFARLMR